MKLFFFSSGRPIIKSYTLSARKKLRKNSYPALFKFTSYEYTTNTIEEFYQCLVAHAEKGNCLLKGQLQRPLRNEPRAGTTSPDTSTLWICLDFDGLTAFKTVDTALNAMGCGNTDYILQWSASNKVEEKEGLNCHVFMLLEDLQHPSLLKQWLKHLNLTLLKEQSLARSGNALLWPIDITTCQNDKLLYVAPPKFEGLDDPYKNEKRISLIKKKHRTLELPRIPTPNEISTLELIRLNDARTKIGLPVRKEQKTATEFDTPYLVHPDVAQITGQKTEREFTYFNLNGGDSWGYYHPVSNPTFIFNFKGEPTYRTEDLLPEYWAELRSRATTFEPDASGSVYLAFRDFESATYWNGVYDTAKNILTKFAQARSESQLRHFMKQHGHPLGDFVPDWDMKFDPHASYTVDLKNKRINVYRPSEFFARPPVPQSQVPPTIAKIIFHALGSDDRVYEHFLNWLAVIVQNLCMTQTAWVIHGTQGTGKGVMFNHILAPIFGDENVTSRRMEELGSNFTEFMKNKFLVFIDESSIGNSNTHANITAKLKNLIVEPRVSVREMYSPSKVMDNYTNIIFASNSPQPVTIAADDRRFNVGAFQQNPIVLTSYDIDSLKKELGSFYNYLGTRHASRAIARVPIETADRTNIINLSRSSIDIAIEALKGGNLSFFVEMLVQKPEILNARSQLTYAQFEALIEELKVTKRTKLSRDDLMIMFRWCIDNVPEAPNKFTTMLRHHGLQLRPLWIDGHATRGYEVDEWKN